MRRLLRFLLALSLLAATRSFVHAQTAAYAEIARIDAATFPQVSALVDVYDANGEFIAGLKPADITVYEDGQEKQSRRSVRASEVPVQVVVAVNPGPPLAIRDSNGVARFERVVETLRRWAEAQPDDSRDDLSLVSLSGSLINHARRGRLVRQPELLQARFPQLDPQPANPVHRAGYGQRADARTRHEARRAVHHPRMDDPNIDNTVAPLIQRAIDSKVRVFVWFIDAEEFNVSPSANAFRMLAQQTDGAFFSFSRAETFPDLNGYFAPLRHVYEVTYTSALTTSGEHTLGFYITAQDTTIPALDRTFSIDVQPPNPIFVSPPLQITRQPPADDPYNRDVLEPSQQIIEIIVEFPDGHRRALKRTTLYVDGQVAAENTKEPFDRFLWDYSAFTESGQHQIVVEAEDVLGLTKSSIGIPVTFTVIHAPSGVEAFLAQYSSQLVMGSLIFAGLGPAGHSGEKPREEPAGIPPPQGPQGKGGPAHPARPGIDGAAVSATKKANRSRASTGWVRGKTACRPRPPISSA
jgi:hypothetical protein